jgi:hypothetical protein
MNGEDQFESRLKRQAMKAAPGAWREEILAAARAECTKDTVHRVPGLSSKRWERGGTRPYVSLIASATTRVFSQLLWPSGKAWAGLAAVWILIIGFSVINRDSGENQVASQGSQSSPLVRELLQEQNRLFVELSGGADQGEGVATRRRNAGPRSRCDVAWREV